MQEYLTITKALSDENRVRAIMCLVEGELCVCELIRVLGLAPATVSKHMTILHQAGLVERRKDGRWHYYRLAGTKAPTIVKRALKWTRDVLADETTIVADEKALCCVRGTDRTKLAACYSAS